MFASAAAPEIVVNAEAFTAPVVLPSSVFRTAPSIVISDNVTASSPKPVIPEDA